MAVNQKINFKDPLWIMAWLDTALKKEKEKYKKCPVIHDIVPGHNAAQGWAYVVAGYFLVECSLKAILRMRGYSSVPKSHSLSELFKLLEARDQSTLREFYCDYKSTIGGNIGAFPFSSLDDFLLNLDGGKDMDGRQLGSFDWRYFLIEEKSSSVMPTVSVDYLHEIVYGCIVILNNSRHDRSDPTQYTRSWRLRSERSKKHYDWLTVRMNSDGWDELRDRLEILWGPDHLGGTSSRCERISSGK